jgi:hypothetical protein
MPVRKDEPLLPETGIIDDNTHKQMLWLPKYIRVAGAWQPLDYRSNKQIIMTSPVIPRG